MNLFKYKILVYEPYLFHSGLLLLQDIGLAIMTEFPPVLGILQLYFLEKHSK